MNPSQRRGPVPPRRRFVRRFAGGPPPWRRAGAPRARRSGLLLALVALLAAPTQVPAPAQAADVPYLVTVRVVITHVLGLDCVDEDEVLGGCLSHPDFYTLVHIDDQTSDTEERVTDDDNQLHPTDWTFEKRVDLAKGAIPVIIRLRDQDGGFRGPFDPVDIDPGVGRDLELTVNLAPCVVGGDATAECTDRLVRTPTITRAGTADDRAHIEFRVEVVDVDDDGDALLNGWETRGLDANGDGAVDVDLPALGANPRRRDLFVEIDCVISGGSPASPQFHSHCPPEPAIADVVRSFANAPPGPATSNPDGSAGIQLHIDTGGLFGVGRVVGVSGTVTGAYGDLAGSGNPLRGGNQIAETAANAVVDWDGATGRPATSLFTIKTANFDARREYAFRYALFGHQTNARSAVNDCTSGWAEGFVVNDFMVTLGGERDTNGDGNGDVPCWTPTAADGIDDDGDGGTDEDPVDGVDNDGDCPGDTDEDGRRCDRGDLRVDEDAGSSVGSRAEHAGSFMHELGHALGLDHGGGDDDNFKPNYFSVMNYSMQTCSVPTGPEDPAALPGGCDYSRRNVGNLDEPLAPRGAGLDECRGADLGVYGFGPSDWNGNRVLDGLSNCNPPNDDNVSADINGDSVRTVLNGFDDWDAITYDFQTRPEFANGTVDPVPDEADAQTLERARELFATLQGPDLTVAKRGPAVASPGDAVSYTLEVANLGRGPAVGTTLRDTLPDGSVTSFDIGFLKVGDKATRTVGFTVQCATADGTVLTDTAAAFGESVIGQPEGFPADNTASVSTTVNAPVLALARAASPTVNAGEAITTTITYGNTGAAGASGVVITDTLPAGVYYSTALDQGDGPRPATVTRDPDGTTTLTWNVGTVPGRSGPRTLRYTARPSLLSRTGSVLAGQARATFTNANGCAYAPVTAAASTTVTEVAPSRDPRNLAFWLLRPEVLTAETLARVHATDQRYDGADGSAPDGRLAAAEVTATLGPAATAPQLVSRELLVTDLNIASRRINAGTAIRSPTAMAIGLDLADVRAAVEHARATLTLPVNPGTLARYATTLTILEEINVNISERY